MRGRVTRSLIGVLLVGMLIAGASCVFILARMERGNSAAFLEQAVDNVISTLNDYDATIREVSESVKDDYVVLARVFAEIIASDPAILEDTPRLQKLAETFDALELHVTDEDGIIRWGNIPRHFGFDLKSTEQSYPHSLALNDPDRAYVEDAMPNGADGVLRQYVSVARKDVKGVVQLGMRPERLERAVSIGSVENVLSINPISRGGYMLAYNNITGRIVYHPDKTLIGMPYADHKPKIALLESAEHGGDTIVAVLPYVDMYGHIEAFALALVLSMTAAMLVALLMLNRSVDKNVISGINRLIALFDKISLGDFSLRADIKDNRELSRISDGVNFMLDNIKQKMEEKDHLLESLTAANDVKSRFLSNISHELRTPINGVMGNAELLLASALRPDERENARNIHRSAVNLTNIINDILAFSAFEQDDVKTENAPFDLSHIWEDAINGADLRARNKGLAFELLTQNIPVVVSGDRKGLTQSLRKLISNAVLYTKNGRVTITDEVVEDTPETISVRFMVSDTGAGMTAEQVKLVTKSSFYRADDGLTRREGGVGLGLPLTVLTIKAMGGELVIHSVKNSGTTFSFALTFEKVMSLSDRNHRLRPRFSGVRALVCDDNFTNRHVLTGHLSMLGIETEYAENGAEGVVAAEAAIKRGKPFDIIFMDIQMPVMDGLAAAKQIKSICAGDKPPIAAVTANSSWGERERYMAEGMDDYVGKPFTAPELWACLLRHLTPDGYEETEAEAEQPTAQNADEVLNTQAGLEYAAEDETFYKEVLTDFYNVNTRLAQEMTEAIASGENEQARQMAHKMKGGAGTIGAFRLKKAAADLEDALKNGGETALPTDEFQEALTLTLMAVKPLTEQREPSAEKPEAPETPQNSLTDEEREAYKTNLIVMLKSGDTRCMDMCQEVLDVWGEKAERLAGYLDEFEFEAAIDELERL